MKYKTFIKAIKYGFIQNKSEICKEPQTIMWLTVYVGSAKDLTSQKMNKFTAVHSWYPTLSGFCREGVPQSLFFYVVRSALQFILCESSKTFYLQREITAMNDKEPFRYPKGTTKDILNMNAKKRYQDRIFYWPLKGTKSMGVHLHSKSNESDYLLYMEY